VSFRREVPIGELAENTGDTAEAVRLERIKKMIDYPIARQDSEMSEFDRLIEAAKHGSVEDVRAIAHNHAELINQKDELGATALHYAALGGHRSVAELLFEQGAEINAADDLFGATPTGWAIEYLREMGGFLAIELDDLAFAIERDDVEWAKRFLDRFPGLRWASDKQGTPFKALADQSGSLEMMSLFEPGIDI
jgi:ankyrin repeat protein